MTVFRAADGQLRSFWKIVRVMALCFAIAVLLALLGSLAHLRWMSDVSIHAGAILAVLISLRLERRPPDSVGLAIRRGWGLDLVVGIVWGAVSIAAVVIGMVWVTKEMSAEVFLGGFGVRELAGSIAFYALVAVGEELLFRGYVISVLRKGLGEVTSILIAAAVFTSMHVINPEYYWFAFVYAFLMGILLGFVFVRRTTLWTVMGFHFAWDTLQSDAVFNFPERGGEAVFAAVLALNVFAARYLAARSRRVGARSNLREGGARWQR